MKNLKVSFPLFFIFVLFANCKFSNAQLFKRLVQSAKHAAQSMAEQKTAEKSADETGNALDNLFKFKIGNPQKFDSSGINDMAAKFATGGETSGGLGNIIGSGNSKVNVSSQDSANAINSFKAATGSVSGYHYTYTTTVLFDARIQQEMGLDSNHVNTYHSIWLTDNGRMRWEMDVSNMVLVMAKAVAAAVNKAKKQPDQNLQQITPKPIKPIVELFHTDLMPKYHIYLDENKERYRLEISSPSQNKQDNKYSITNIGTETVNGYSCHHAQLNIDGKSPVDIWTSTEVPGYDIFKKELVAAFAKDDNDDGLFTSLQQANAMGFFVKVSFTSESKESFDFSLTKAQHISNIPGSYFTIPADYTEDYQ